MASDGDLNLPKYVFVENLPVRVIEREGCVACEAWDHKSKTLVRANKWLPIIMGLRPSPDGYPEDWEVTHVSREEWEREVELLRSR